jgi:hypothetical protein
VKPESGREKSECDYKNSFGKALEKLPNGLKKGTKVRGIFVKGMGMAAEFSQKDGGRNIGFALVPNTTRAE